MARTRFASDSGLTFRMTSVMFLLGAVFVGLVVAVILILPPAWAPIIAVIAIGIAWGQWYFSDTVAMKAMRAREVTPEQAPELHAHDRPPRAPSPTCRSPASASPTSRSPTPSRPAARRSGPWSA